MRLDAAQAASVELAAEVKAKLVQFAMSPPFQKHLRRVARELIEESPDIADPGVQAVERLLFSFTYDDGSTAVDRFLRRPGLSAAEQAMARGFVDGVDGVFEVVADTAAGAEVFEVRCCVSDLQHAVAPTLLEGMPDLPRGLFLAGRLNPVAGRDLWTLSGALEVLPAERREAVAQAVMELSIQAPWLTHRNPEKLRQATERVAAVHAGFLARHGSDLVLVAGSDLPGLFAEAMAPEGDYDPEVIARSRAKLRKTIEDSELFHDDQVLVHSHPVAGFGFYRDFAEVARALEAGAGAAEDDIELLRGYLHAPGVPAWLLRRIVADRLPAAESAVARAAGRPSFNWVRDGDDLLASLPGDQQPALTLSIGPSISSSLPASP